MQFLTKLIKINGKLVMTFKIISFLKPYDYSILKKLLYSVCIAYFAANSICIIVLCQAVIVYSESRCIKPLFFTFSGNPLHLLC